MSSHVLHEQALHKAPVLPGALPGALRGAGGSGGLMLGLAQFARQALAPERLVHAAGGPAQRDHQRARPSLDIPACLPSQPSGDVHIGRASAAWQEQDSQFPHLNASQLQVISGFLHDGRSSSGALDWIGVKCTGIPDLPC